jgi:hypothetical protein
MVDLQPLVRARLAGVALLPELERMLQRLVVYDQERAAASHWGAIVPAIQCILGGAPEVIAPFAAAWSLMYAATIRLDQLQDGDPIDDPLPVHRLSDQYNLVFSYYVFGTSLLDLLPGESIPAQRILRLRQFWNDTMLRMAGGQQRDLTTHPTDCAETPLDHYQQLAQAKTGAAYALAFGGTAILLSDDSRLIEALTVIGEMYGTLIQYSDDLLDAAAQPNPTLTLPEALCLAHPGHVSDQTGHTPVAFGAYLYRIYYEQAALMLAELQPDTRAGILDLFAQTFTSQPAEV